MGFELNLICCVKGKPLCAESVRGKECEKEIRKGLSRSEQNWLHGFCRDCFFPSKPKLCSNNRKVMEKKPENIKQSSKSVNLRPKSERHKVNQKQVKL